MTQDPLFLVSVYMFTAVLARSFRPNLLTALLLAVVMMASAGYLGTRHSEEILQAIHHGRDFALTMTGNPPAWPPERSRTYLDLELLDQDGNPTRLTDFRGKVILVELVAMNCPASIAYSGGRTKGAFEDVIPRTDLEPIEEYVRRIGRIRIDDHRLVFVQIVLFNRQKEAPSKADVKAWAEHFGFRRDRNQIVLAGTSSMATLASRNMVPGFHLVDKNFVLRAVCTGGHSGDTFFTDFLPQIRQLTNE